MKRPKSVNGPNLVRYGNFHLGLAPLKKDYMVLLSCLDYMVN